MAVVQAMLLCADPQLQTSASRPGLRSAVSNPELHRSGATMGSVSSLISGGSHGTRYHEHRAAATARRVVPPGRPHLKGGLLQRNGLLRARGGCSSKESVTSLIGDDRPAHLPTRAPMVLVKDERSTAARQGPHGDYVQLSGGGVGLEGDEKDEGRVATAASAVGITATVPIIRDGPGPPPKIVPISGKLEKSVEKKLIRPIALKPAAQGSRTPRASQQRPLKATAEHARGSPLPPPPPHRWNSSEGLYQNIGAQVPTTQQSQRSAPLSDLGHKSLSCLPTASGGAPGAPSEAAPATPGKISASTGHIDHIAAPGAPTSTNLNQSGRKPQAMEPGSVSAVSTLDSGRGSSDSGQSGRLTSVDTTGSCDQSPCSDDLYDLEEEFRRRWALAPALENDQQLRDDRQLQSHYETELAELRQAYTSRLRTAAQRAQRAQHLAQLQIFQLTQERRRLQEELSRLRGERETMAERCATFQRQQSELTPRLEETEWEVCQKSGEIALLKQQLKDAQAEGTSKRREMVSLRAQLKEVQAEVDSRDEKLNELQERLHSRAAELEVYANELQRRASEANVLREKLGCYEAEWNSLQRCTEKTLSETAVTVSKPCERFLGVNNGEERAVGGRCSGSPSVKPCSPNSGGAAEGLNITITQGFQDNNGWNKPGEHELEAEVEQLQAEVTALAARNNELEQNFASERQVWQEEKEKVLRYQRQLQQSYVQMFQRSRVLEREVQQLTAELVCRDLEEVDAHSEFSFKAVAASAEI
uniref:Leucine zipper, putative tumor suppressor family member 3b n=1 Tax=Eptatretus burgeri TaxID=7764 RepID=A0A8C4QYU5_EPTBU